MLRMKFFISKNQGVPERRGPVSVR